MATNGNKGRFSDRIKRIAFRKKNRIISDEIEGNKIKYQHVLKVLAAIPGMVYSNIHIDDNEQKKDVTVTNLKPNQEINRQYFVDIINSIDVTEIRKKQEIYFKSIDNSKVVPVTVVKKSINESFKNIENTKDKLKLEDDNNDKVEESNEKKVEYSYTVKAINDNVYENNVEIVDNNANDKVQLEDNEFDKLQEISEEDNKRVEKLEKDILNIIKKKLVLSINTLEILQSDLYILSEVKGDAKTKEECEQQIKEIKQLLNRIEKLKEQYDFLKDNYDFEYLMALGDDNLIDKIVELKDVFDKNQVRAFVKDYKLLDEYKYLYLKIDKLQDKTNELESKKEDDLENLKKRNIDFNELKNKVSNISSLKSVYDNMLNDQMDIIKKLDEDISKINSYEQVDYQIKGLNKLLLNSFKYFGLLLLNPLKGTFPAIAIQTLMTKDMLKEAYHGIKWEEKRKMVYDAIDYSSSIDKVVSNMDYISDTIDNTLGDLIRLKEIYKEKFSIYQSDNTEYKDIINKLNDMANKMMGNKIKVEILRKKALDQKKINNKKLVLVDKLNNDQK